MINRRPNKVYMVTRTLPQKAELLKSTSVTLGQTGKGIVVGKVKDNLIRYIKPDFVSLGAGTRAGKGAGW